MISAPGVYDIPASEYHADPAEKPSLSHSIAHELLTYSPAHARFAHPRLNPNYEREQSADFDLGTAAHMYLLEGNANFSVIDARDWRTKTAQEGRDDARSRGKVPLLVKDWVRVQEMARAAREQLEVHEARPVPLQNGRPEVTLFWHEEGVWMRARPDWLHDDGFTIDDYKTTGGSANPESFSRTLFDKGYDVQAAFYMRGLRAVLGKEPVWRFVVQETFPPYGLSVIDLGPDVLTIAEKKVRHAIEIWRHCLETRTFPGYPRRTCTAELPPWEEARWLERELRDDGRPLSEQL